MGFADDIKAFRDKALKQASESTNKIVRDYFKANVDYSPTPNGKGGYSLGTIKNNWYASTSTPDFSYSGSVDAAGSGSISRIDSVLAAQPFLSKDNTVYLTNSTKWAYRADKIGWGSGDPTNDTGWHWSGRITAYMFTATALQYTINKWA